LQKNTYMSKVFSLSEAATISIHAMIIIARSDKQLNANELAILTEASRHHLSKILQRLTKVGFVSSSRGPQGGFTLNKNPEEITMLDIFEAIEGKVDICKCELKKNVCPTNKCIVNNLVNKMTQEFVDYFQKQTLKDFIYLS